MFQILQDYRTTFSRKRLKAALISISFIIHEPADSKDEKFFNNSQ